MIIYLVYPDLYFTFYSELCLNMGCGFSVVNDVFLNVVETAITTFLLCFTLKHEGGDGADRTEREAMHRSHSQLPYFLGRPSQEHTVIKSGYCVKQGAVVSTCCNTPTTSSSARSGGLVNTVQKHTVLEESLTMKIYNTLLTLLIYITLLP